MRRRRTMLIALATVAVGSGVVVGAVNAQDPVEQPTEPGGPAFVEPPVEPEQPAEPGGPAVVEPPVEAQQPSDRVEG